MTNSTPKSNKIERQGSPKCKKSPPQQRKSVTYFASSPSKDSTPRSGATTPVPRKQPSVARQNCSPINIKGMQSPLRSSPMRYESPRGSPTNSFYAGAKFSEPPSPATLPKPPMHWTGLVYPTTSCQQSARMMMLPCNITQHFSELINIQA